MVLRTLVELIATRCLRFVASVFTVLLAVATPCPGNAYTGSDAAELVTRASAFIGRATVLVRCVLTVVLSVTHVFELDALTPVRTSELVGPTLDWRAPFWVFIRGVVAVVVAVAEPIDGNATTVSTGELVCRTRGILAQLQFLVGAITAVVV